MAVRPRCLLRAVCPRLVALWVGVGVGLGVAGLGSQGPGVQVSEGRRAGGLSEL